jgi:hypothetical protein
MEAEGSRLTESKMESALRVLLAEKCDPTFVTIDFLFAFQRQST